MHINSTEQVFIRETISNMATLQSSDDQIWAKSICYPKNPSDECPPAPDCSWFVRVGRTFGLLRHLDRIAKPTVQVVHLKGNAAVD